MAEGLINLLWWFILIASARTIHLNFKIISIFFLPKGLPIAEFQY